MEKNLKGTMAVTPLSETELVVSIGNLPKKLTEIPDYVTKSVNNKNCPSFETQVVYEITLEDGTVTTLSGKLALWFDKNDVKQAEIEKRKVFDKALKEIADAKKQVVQTITKEVASVMSPESISTLLNNGWVLEKDDSHGKV